MKATVVSYYRMWSFRLAAQLGRLGCLDRLISADPRASFAPGVPPLRVLPIPLDVARVLSRRLPSLDRLLPAERRVELFERAAGAMLGTPDVVVAWSGTAMRTLVAARRIGAMALVERGSQHIETQAEAQREEADRLGMRVPPFDAAAIARELEEYAYADRIVVPSRLAAESFVARGIPASRLVRVPYGVDTSLFSPGPPPPRPLRVITVSNVFMHKGTHYVIEAFVRAKLPNAELLVVGPIDPVIEPLLRRLATPAVRFLGRKRAPEVAELLRSSHVFCLASIDDGYPLALVEAMATGLPVITTTTVGACEAVRQGESGFVVAPRDVSAITEALVLLDGDEERRRAMGAAARADMAKATWDDYGDAIAAAYRRALAEMGRRVTD